VGGAAAALCGQPFYRLLARQPAALAAAVAALLASGAHASPRSSAAVAQYALQLVVSFIRPPALAQAQVRAAVAGRRRPPGWGKLTAHGTSRPTRWRRCRSNGACCFSLFRAYMGATRGPL